MIQRPKILRPLALFLAIAGWAFLLFCLASFHSTDWPSHSVYPYPPTRNLCGPAGAFIAYWCFLAIGQGVFPLLFFTGVCLALLMYQSKLTDPWLRIIGMSILCVAFAALVHHVWPGSDSGFPEGQGGVIGIGTAAYLQSHFHTVGTRLVLTTVIFIGLLLAADDLVLKAPGVAMQAYSGVREHAPRFHFSIPKWLHLPQPKQKTVKPASAKPSKVVLDDPEDRIAPIPAAAPIAEKVDKKPKNEVADDEIEDAALAKIVAPPAGIIVNLPNMVKQRQVSPPPPPKELGDYALPAWNCLAEAEHGFAASQEKFVREKAELLEQALRDFNIDARVVQIDTGPVITMYQLAIGTGVKVSSISALQNDIMRALRAESVRIVAPVPGKDTVGIEAPNEQKEIVRLKELMQSAPESIKKMAIPLYLGKDASGEPIITDLTQMPHCLIAGTTGSGKSVCINSIIMSILYQQRPDLVKLILVDPKMVEMQLFKDIPHLMCPVIDETGKATSVLEWACEKMDERYSFLAEAGVRSIKGYNALTRDELRERFKPSNEEEEGRIPKHLPYIVLIIDELADLMMTSGKDVEAFIVRLAQKSRAVGIHLILATQRPQANVVTGLIKSNMGSRIAFRVASRMDSRIVLDQNGADLLLGQGDMLFLPPGSSKPVRGQGTFIDDREIRESVKLVRTQAEAQYEPDLVQLRSGGSVDHEAIKDELFDPAVREVLKTKRGSVSLLQRRLTIGYSRASRLIEAMAAAGIVGAYKGSQAREALINEEEWESLRTQLLKDAESGMTV